MALKETLKQKIEEFRPRTTKLIKEFGKVVIDQVTIDQAIGGARDIRCLVTDISYLDPQEGIRFRGKTIPETFEALPKAPAPSTRRSSRSGTSSSPARCRRRPRSTRWLPSGRPGRTFPSTCSTRSARCRARATRW